MAWQGNGMDTAWARYAMCESAFKVQAEFVLSYSVPICNKNVMF